MKTIYKYKVEHYYFDHDGEYQMTIFPEAFANEFEASLFIRKQRHYEYIDYDISDKWFVKCMKWNEQLNFWEYEGRKEEKFD